MYIEFANQNDRKYIKKLKNYLNALQFYQSNVSLSRIIIEYSFNYEWKAL